MKLEDLLDQDLETGDSDIQNTIYKFTRINVTPKERSRLPLLAFLEKVDQIFCNVLLISLTSVHLHVIFRASLEKYWKQRPEKLKTNGP